MKQLFRHLKRTFHDLDKRLLLACIIINIIGLLFIASSASSQFGGTGLEIFSYFFKQLALLLASTFLGIFIVSTDTSVYKKLIMPAYIIIIGILMFMIAQGDAHRGSINWIEIAGITFQPSEFTKLLLIIFLAVTFEKFYYNLKTNKEEQSNIIAKFLVIGLTPVAVVFLQNDFGTMLVLSGIFVVMFFTSPISRQYKLKSFFLIVIMIIGFCLFQLSTKGYILTAEQIDRFNYINPCSNYEEGGYQICNSMIAINNGNLFGVGAGKSSQKYSYIPEAHTDSIFAIIVEEMGLLLSTIIFILYAYILYRIMMLACYANTVRGRYICVGTAAYLFSHILINLGGLFGLLPLTGIPLPFISYGGSFIISATLTLAVTQRVHIETKRSYTKKMKKNKKVQL